MKKQIKVLQFICPTGFYGAERWVLALAKNSQSDSVCHYLAVTEESESQDLEIVRQFPHHERTYQLSMRGRFDFSVIAKLSKIIREKGIDVIHTHGYKSDILGWLAARKAGIKCVSTPHGFGIPKDLKLKLFIRLGAFCLRFFDAVAPLSKQLLDEVAQYGVPKSRCHYIQNAVDLTEIDEFLWKKNPSNSRQVGGKKRIGFIGQMIPRKNIRDAIDIFEQLWQNNQQLEFLLLGDGDSRQELEKYATSLASSAAIKFMGFRNDRLDILKDLDLFVMTSSSEGIPRCLMEACAMEIPVAAYNIPGIDQLLEHEQTGLLAPFSDKQTLAEYWQTLLDDRDYAEQLAKNARDFILQKFSGQRMAREYFELFQTLLGEPKQQEAKSICAE